MGFGGSGVRTGAGLPFPASCPCPTTSPWAGKQVWRATFLGSLAGGFCCAPGACIVISSRPHAFPELPNRTRVSTFVRATQLQPSPARLLRSTPSVCVYAGLRARARLRERGRRCRRCHCRGGGCLCPRGGRCGQLTATRDRVDASRLMICLSGGFFGKRVLSPPHSIRHSLPTRHPTS